MVRRWSLRLLDVTTVAVFFSMSLDSHFVGFFGWAQVHGLVENVASMDYNMSQAYGERPWLIDSLGASLSRWLRLYWVT